MAKINGGGKSRVDLNDVTDITITAVADNELLAYDSGTSEWINQTASEVGLATIGDLHNAVTVTDSAEIDFTLVGQDITASIVVGSIDETKLDTSVNASLDLADSSTQPGDNISTLTNDSGFITDYTVTELDVTTHEGAITITASQVSDFDTEVSNNTSVSANTTHRTSNGSDHTYINQDVTTTGTPTFSGLTANNNLTTKTFNTAIGSVISNTALGESHHTVLADSSASPVTLTLPASSSNSGRLYLIKCKDSTNGVTVDGSGTETIDGSETINLIKHESVTLQSDGNGWWIL